MLHLFLKHLNFVQQKLQFLIEDRETKIGKEKKKSINGGNSSKKNSKKFSKIVEKENLINKIECLLKWKR